MLYPAALSAEPASVAVGETAPVTEEDDVPRLNLPGIGILDASHGYFSKNIEGLSDSVDTFFGDDRIFEEASGTYVQVRSSMIYSKYGTFDFDTQLRAKIKLTNLKRLGNRVQLLISGDDDGPSGPITSGGELGNLAEDLDPSTSLQVLLLEKERWDIRIQPGVKFRTPIDPFVKLRVRRQQPLGEAWLTRTTVYPAWYKSRGFEFPGTLDFERGTGQGAFFRASTNVLWYEEENKNLFAGQSFFFSHPLTKRSQMAYNVGVSFEREPRWRDTGYFATIRYRANIHRGWIFFEVKPQILFQRESDFKPDPSLALTLELFYGSHYLR